MVYRWYTSTAVVYNAKYDEASSRHLDFKFSSLYIVTTSLVKLITVSRHVHPYIVLSQLTVDRRGGDLPPQRVVYAYFLALHDLRIVPLHAILPENHRICAMQCVPSLALEGRCVAPLSILNHADCDFRRLSRRVVDVLRDLDWTRRSKRQRSSGKSTKSIHFVGCRSRGRVLRSHVCMPCHRVVSYIKSIFAAGFHSTMDRCLTQR